LRFLNAPVAEVGLKRIGIEPQIAQMTQIGTASILGEKPFLFLLAAAEPLQDLLSNGSDCRYSWFAGPPSGAIMSVAGA